METRDNKRPSFYYDNKKVHKKAKHGYFPVAPMSKKNKNLKLKVKLASFSKNKLKKQRQRKERIEKMLKKYEKTLELHQQSKLNDNFGFKTIIVLFFELLKIIITIWKFITGN
jgi:hypothetical protein